MKVAELEGVGLDCWTAKAEGYTLEPYRSGYRMRNEQNEVVGFIGPKYETMLWNYSPSTDWSQGGPIIERERITLDGYTNDWDASSRLTPISGPHMAPCYRMRGDTALIAAMRSYVASKFGLELDDRQAHHI